MGMAMIITADKLILFIVLNGLILPVNVHSLITWFFCVRSCGRSAEIF